MFLYRKDKVCSFLFVRKLQTLFLSTLFIGLCIPGSKPLPFPREIPDSRRQATV